MLLFFNAHKSKGFGFVPLNEPENMLFHLTGIQLLFGMERSYPLFHVYVCCLEELLQLSNKEILI